MRPDDTFDAITLAGAESNLTVNIGPPLKTKDEKEVVQKDMENGGDNSSYTVDTTTGFFNQYSFS